MPSAHEDLEGNIDYSHCLQDIGRPAFTETGLRSAWCAVFGNFVATKLTQFEKTHQLFVDLDIFRQ